MLILMILKVKNLLQTLMMKLTDVMFEDVEPQFIKEVINLAKDKDIEMITEIIDFTTNTDDVEFIEEIIDEDPEFKKL